MHELGIINGVLDASKKAAVDAGATKLVAVSLSYGEMTEVIEDALRFAFEALTEDDPFLKGATLNLNIIKPKSRCLDCGHEFEHDRFHVCCPQCESPMTQLLCGREMNIDSIEVETPEEGDNKANR
ncbi:MAG: hydrogenase maturation nickel metallochaperone HypA [Eggerthellaceae bacterium]|nr:hydrogenase maturation nickel metallochaperone HypA [Eggerthellaceae bacterium]